MKLKTLALLAALTTPAAAAADPVHAAYRLAASQAPLALEAPARPGFDLDPSTGLAAPVPRGPSFASLPTAGPSPRYAAPDGPVRAVAFFFHGLGGSSQLADDVEVRAVLQAVRREGVAIVVPDAANRDTRKFDNLSPTASNDDLRHLFDALAALEAIGVPADTPLFLIGYSAGGAFAGYAGHALLEAGFDLRGVLYHQSRGDSRAWGAPPPVPSVWLPAEHDEIIDPWNIEQLHFDHLAAGHEGLLLWHTAERFDARRFTRDPRVAPADAAAILQAARRSGWLDTDDQLRADAPPQAVAKDIADQLGPRLAGAVRRQLKVALATHAFNGAFAAREAAFIREHL